MIFYFGNQFPTSITTLQSKFGGRYTSSHQKYFQWILRLPPIKRNWLIISGFVHIILNRIGLWKQKIGNPLMLPESCSESSVPTFFSVESISTAVHLINRLSSLKLQHQSPYLRMCGQWTSCSYNHLHTFGCLCFVHLPSSKRNKLSAQSTKCAFLGYAPYQKGFIAMILPFDIFKLS